MSNAQTPHSAPAAPGCTWRTNRRSPTPGDYVLRYIVRDPFVVVRDAGGHVRALLNHCRHKGMQICRSEAGNASHLRCPYHGWTYRNDGALVGVPAQRDAYGDALDRSKLGLHAIRSNWSR